MVSVILEADLFAYGEEKQILRSGRHFKRGVTLIPQTREPRSEEAAFGAAFNPRCEMSAFLQPQVLVRIEGDGPVGKPLAEGNEPAQGQLVSSI